MDMLQKILILLAVVLALVVVLTIVVIWSKFAQQVQTKAMNGSYTHSTKSRVRTLSGDPLNVVPNPKLHFLGSPLSKREGDDCITRKTGIPKDRLGSVLVRIGRVIKMDVAPGRCDGCLSTRRVFRLV